MDRAFAGITEGLAFPVVMIMWIGGHLSRTAAASFSPFIESGMSMSVNTSRTSCLPFRISMARSACLVTPTVNRASSSSYATYFLINTSSSTIRTAAISLFRWSCPGHSR